MPKASPKRRRKRPALNLALRQIRSACGMTQAEFAAMVEVSTDYLKSVELGRRAASKDFAARVTTHTGAWQECIEENWPEAVDSTLNPFTSDSFKSFQEEKSKVSHIFASALHNYKMLTREAANFDSGRAMTLLIEMKKDLDTVIGPKLEELVKSYQEKIEQLKAKK